MRKVYKYLTQPHFIIFFLTLHIIIEGAAILVPCQLFLFDLNKNKSLFLSFLIPFFNTAFFFC